MEKNVTLNKGFKRPVIKFPMSIAESNTDLRGAKSTARKIRGQSNPIRLNATVFGWAMSLTTDVLHLALSNKITKKSIYSLLVNNSKSGKAS